jgi:tetratricopeptide (TPR) repeat protein
MPLLELAIAEDPHCPRNAFYHARELTFYSRWKDAIEYLNKYLAMPEATWQNERCYAYRLLGKSYAQLGNLPQSTKMYRLAVAEAPGTREPWVELAQLAYSTQNWTECYAAAKSALNIRDKALVYTMDPTVWTERPYDLASIAAWNLGLKTEAAELTRKALEIAPDNERLQNNLKLMS